MEKLKNKLMTLLSPEERVPYDEESNNGLIILDDKYVPPELLCEVLCHIDYKTLLSCNLVCKCWNDLMMSYVWRKKAETILKHSLPVDENVPWTKYYFICSTNSFNKNLIRNHSGEKGVKSCWNIIKSDGDHWNVETQPIGTPPLPEDPVFEGRNNCFVTSYGSCWKQQTINLVQEGFLEYLLDNIQPTILVSEWYSCRWDCPAIYACKIELLKGTTENSDENLGSYEFDIELRDDNQNIWFKFEHEFKNYGKGLRRIRFSHGGQDRRFWAGHFGSKMAGACIQLTLPEFHK